MSRPRGRPPQLVHHGTEHAYKRCGCRCSLCSDNARRKRQEYIARRKGIAPRPEEVAVGVGYSDEVIARRCLAAAGAALDLRLAEVVGPGHHTRLACARRGACDALRIVLGWVYRRASAACGISLSAAYSETVNLHRLAVLDAAREAATREAHTIARELEAHNAAARRNERDRVRAIAEGVAAEFGIGLGSLCASTGRRATEARHEALRRMVDAGHSRRTIAEVFGFSYSSTCHMLRKANAHPGPSGASAGAMAGQTLPVQPPSTMLL